MSVHLHVRSACTLLDATMSVEQIVKRARSLGYHSVALTDANCMHGAMDFYHICKKEGIHPVFGLECSFLWKNQKVSCVLLAEDVTLDEEVLSTAKAKGINILSTPLAAFEAAVKISGMI